MLDPFREFPWLLPLPFELKQPLMMAPLPPPEFSRLSYSCQFLHWQVTNRNHLHEKSSLACWSRRKTTIEKTKFCKKITFRVWSTNAADSRTEPLTIPGVNLSCFGAGSDTGDKGPLMSSAKCFDERHELPCWIPFRSVRATTELKYGVENPKFRQNVMVILILAVKHLVLHHCVLSQMNKGHKVNRR